MTITIGPIMIHIGRSEDVRIHAHARDLAAACEEFQSELRAYRKYNADETPMTKGEVADYLEQTHWYSDEGPGDILRRMGW
jgi:uncharacterized protein Yka (UPF0111/DUF47 family)